VGHLVPASSPRDPAEQLGDALVSDLVVVGFFLVPELVCGGRDDLAAYGRPRQVVPGSLGTAVELVDTFGVVF
jgi:hypothetical protein